VRHERTVAQAVTERARSMRISDCSLSLPGTGEILSGLDLQLPCGAVTWLVGESGMGKSTLCNLLAGLGPRGAKMTGALEVGVGGETADHAPQRFDFGTSRGRRGLAKMRRSGVLAWAPQNAMDTFPPRLLLRDWFARAGFGIPDLVPFGLENSMLEKFPHQFSGGQISRISLAAALARSPRLLVCDEPTAGLDPEQADAVIAVINEHASGADRAVLAVTHDLSGLQRNARPEDRVAVIFAGHIVEVCSAADFLGGRAENAYARALPAAAPAAGAHPLPVADEARPRPWAYHDGDELRRLGEGGALELGDDEGPVGRLGEGGIRRDGFVSGGKDGGGHGTR
jgi:ABC-type glutathione transport system ATPase component